jgi:hypothetical protein
MKKPGIRWCNSSVLNGKVIILITLIALLISCHSQSTQEEIFGVKVSDLRGGYRSLSELREHRATVLIFLSWSMMVSIMARRKIQQTAQRQRPFYGLIRVGILSTALHRPRIIPTRQHGIIQPQGQAASGDQRTIIRRPVFDTIDRFFPDRGRGFRYVIHHRISGKRGSVSTR